MTSATPTPGSASAPPTSRELAGKGAGVAAIVLALTGFSWGFIIIKVIPLPPPVIALARLLAGGLILTAVALALRTRWPLHWGAVIGAGIAFGAHQLLYIAATQLTSVAIVTIIGATQPLLIALVSRRTVGEPVSLRLVACSALALGGVALVMLANLDAHSRSWQGDLLAVANTLVFTGYFLFAKRARMNGAPTLTFTASFYWIAILVVAPVIPLVGGARLPDGAELGLIVILAMGPGNGHLLVNWAHRRVTAALSSLILASVPLLSGLWAYLILDEPFTWRHILGMLIVVAAIEIGRRADPAARAVTEEPAVSPGEPLP